MNGVLIILFSLLYCILMFALLNKRKRTFNLSLVNITILINILIFGIGLPLNYFLSMYGYNTQTYIQNYTNLNTGDIAFYYLAMTACTTSFVLALKIGKQIYITSETSNKSKIEKNKLLLIGISLLAIGIVANYLYLKAYGSYSNYLNYSKLLRSGIMTVDNKFSFLMPFRNCTIMSTYILTLSLKEKKNKILKVILLLISVYCSCMTLYSNSGRLSFAIYIILGLFAFFYQGKITKISIKLVFKILVILIVVGIATVFIGSILNRNSTNSLLATLNSEITFPFQNIIIVKDKMSNIEYRLLFDGIAWVFYLLPSSIWATQLHIKTASSIVTSAWFGHAKGYNGITTEMPADFVTISYIQLGLLGIIILPIIFAIIYKKIISLIDRIKNKDLRLFMIIYVFITFGVSSIYYCDPYLITQKSIPLITFAILYAAYGTIDKKKRIKKKVE